MIYNHIKLLQFKYQILILQYIVLQYYKFERQQYQRMSIRLNMHQNTKNVAKKYQTNGTKSSRSFQAYNKRQQGLETSRTKAFNMNDLQRRIKRQQNSLYKQSTQQSALFQKGLRKIVPKFASQQKVQSKQKSVKKAYHNKQTYNVLNPPKEQQKVDGQVGVRRIYLYDQTKQSSADKNLSTGSRRHIKDNNKQSYQKSSAGVYLVKKLSTHANAATQWHNSIAPLRFVKKDNIINKQNAHLRAKQQNIKKNYKQGTQNVKNKSQFETKQNGITLGQSLGSSKYVSKEIDFNQKYYEKYSRLNLNERKNSHSGYLSYRNK